MKVLSATLLLASLFGAAIADGDCGSNALLTADMIARFGGSANILTTSRVLSSTTATCSFMVNQSVCVSDAGFTYFQTYLNAYRQNFTSSSQKRDQERYAGVGAQLNGQNQSDPRTQNIIQVGNLFNQTVINFTQAGSSSPYDFTAFLSMVAQWSTYIAPTQNQQNQQNQLIMANNTRHGNPPMMGVNNTTVAGGNNNQQGQQQSAQQSQQQQQQNGDNGSQQNGGNGSQQNGGNGGQQNGSQQNGSQQNGGQQQQQIQQQVNGGASVSGNASGTHRLRALQQNNNGNGNNQNSNQGPPQNNSGWVTLQQNLGQAKAKCGISVMKQYYYATCLAALVSSATNGTVSGSTSDPTVTMSSNACSGYKSKCYDYFTYASQAENVLANVQNANSLFAMNIYAIISNSSLSTADKNTQLNVYASQVQTILVSASQNATTAPWSPISCNNTNTDGSSCNYICTNVISATGFDEDNFNLISSTTDGNVATTSRRNLASSGSVILSSTSSGINPDSAISDSNSAVVVSAQGTVDASGNSRALIASLAAFISVAIAFAF